MQIIKSIKSLCYIPKITQTNQKIVDKIITLVDKILVLKAKDSNTLELENEIDKLIYKLYNLIQAEIQFRILLQKIKR